MKKKLIISLSGVIIISICFTSVAMLKAIYLEDVILNKANTVLDGHIANTPSRMMIYRDGKHLTAYFILNSDNTEYALTGSYNKITRHFKLYNNDKTISMNGNIHPNSNSKDYYILSGDYNKKSDEKGEFSFVPEWELTGKSKEDITSQGKLVAHHALCVHLHQ